MASSAKSEKLGLSLWEASDMPERLDFRGDNEALEALVGGHLGDAAKHLDAAEKQFLERPYYTTTFTGIASGSNTGRSKNYRTQMSKIKMAFVMALGHAPVEYDANGKAHVYWDVSVDESVGSTKNVKSVMGGVLITPPTSVYTCSKTLSDGTVLHLNDQGVTYLQILVQDVS